MKKIAIVAVNYNGYADTADFIESFKKLDTSGFEVTLLIVDNGSPDGSGAEIHKKFGEKILFVQLDKNYGFTGGYNRGVRSAYEWGADYILVINNDVLFNSKNLLHELVKVIESSPTVAVVVPKIYFAPGYEYHKDRYKKSEIGKVLWYAGGSFDWSNVNSIHRGIDEVDTGKYDMVEEVDFANGCCFLVKREVVAKEPIFDEKLFSYYEDGDFSMRLKKQGYRIYYDGEVSIYHKVGKTGGIGSPFNDYMSTRNQLYFGMRYSSLRTKFALMRQAVRFLLMGRPYQRRGVLDYLRGVGGLPSDVVKPKS